MRPAPPAAGGASGGSASVAADLSLRPEPPIAPAAAAPAPPARNVSTPMDPAPTGRARISGAYEPPAPRRTGDLPPRQADTGTRPRMHESGRRQTDDGLRLQTEEPSRGRGADSDPLDLPLFDPGVPMPADDRPLVSATLPPRPPLSVRRTTDTGTRPRARATPQPGGAAGGSTTSTSTSVRPTPSRLDEPRLDLDFSGAGSDAAIVGEPDLSTLGDGASDAVSAGIGAGVGTGTRSGRRSTATDDAQFGIAEDGVSAAAAAEAETDAAPLSARATAGAIDIAFLLLIDLIVLHFTFRLTGVPFGAWGRLPLAPLLGFLGLMHGGYLAMFTAASGQTMGKMVAGVKVVATGGGAVPFGQAVLRALVWLIGVPTLVGLIPALLSGDRRALHDRFADTKVIKAE